MIELGRRVGRRNDSPCFPLGAERARPSARNWGSKQMLTAPRLGHGQSVSSTARNCCPQLPPPPPTCPGVVSAPSSGSRPYTTLRRTDRAKSTGSWDTSAMRRRWAGGWAGGRDGAGFRACLGGGLIGRQARFLGIERTQCAAGDAPEDQIPPQQTRARTRGARRRLDRPPSPQPLRPQPPQKQLQQLPRRARVPKRMPTSH